LNSPMLLQTERLRLTAWEASDSIAFRAIASDPDVMRYIELGPFLGCNILFVA